MHCSRCALPISSEDNFCRQCGTAVTVIDVPAIRGGTVPARVWRGAGPAVARGVALVAAGAMLRLLLGLAGRAMGSRGLPDSVRNRGLPNFPGFRSESRGGDDVEILWYRRTRR